MEAVLLALLLMGGSYGFLLMGRRKYLVSAENANPNLPKLSIIIPARNEENNVKKLFASLDRQALGSFPVEVIVVDDQSTDRTAEVAYSWGAEVITNSDLPGGWTGKTFALHNGAQHATGECFLFVDADVEFEPGAIPSFYSQFVQTTNLEAHAILPYHQIEKPYECLSVFFNLLMAMGTDAFLLGGAEKEKLVGQVLLIRKESYWNAGGHQGVSGEVLENFFLSKKLEQVNVKCRTFFGKGIVRFRMFPDGMAQLIEGWKKAFARGASEVTRVTLIKSIIWITALMTTIVLMPLMPAVAWKLYLFFTIQMLILQSRVGRYFWWSAFLWPVTLIFYQYVYFSAIAAKRSGVKATWRGREL